MTTQTIEGGAAPGRPQDRRFAALEALLAERRAAQGARRRGPRSPRLLGLARRLRRLADGARLLAVDGAGRLLRAERVLTALPAYGGVFELPLSSDVTRYLLIGRFERALPPILRAALGGGGDLVDVGANAGLYSVLGARLLGGRGRVLAVEAAPAAADLLEANLARNGLAGVLVHRGAAAAAAGRATLHVLEGSEEYASLGGRAHPLAPRRRARAVEVPTAPLDELVEGHGLRPALLKLDVEGAEGLVLQGAARTLARHRPAILSELDDRLLAPLGWDARRVLALLAAAGYVAHDAVSGEALAAPARYIGEIVALPR